MAGDRASADGGFRGGAGDRGRRPVRRRRDGLLEGGVLRCLNQDLQDVRIFRMAGDRASADGGFRGGAGDRGRRPVRRRRDGLLEGGVLRCLNQDLQDVRIFRMAGDRASADGGFRGGAGDRGRRPVRRRRDGLLEGGVLRCLNQDLQDVRIFRMAGDRASADGGFRGGAGDRGRRPVRRRRDGFLEGGVLRCLNQDLQDVRIFRMAGDRASADGGFRGGAGDRGRRPVRRWRGTGFWRGALRGVSPRTREGRRPDRP